MTFFRLWVWSLDVEIRYQTHFWPNFTLFVSFTAFGSSFFVSGESTDGLWKLRDAGWGNDFPEKSDATLYGPHGMRASHPPGRSPTRAMIRLFSFLVLSLHFPPAIAYLWRTRTGQATTPLSMFNFGRNWELNGQTIITAPSRTSLSTGQSTSSIFPFAPPPLSPTDQIDRFRCSIQR